jgi:hypothetical protein
MLVTDAMPTIPKSHRMLWTTAVVVNAPMMMILTIIKAPMRLCQIVAPFHSTHIILYVLIKPQISHHFPLYPMQGVWTIS